MVDCRGFVWIILGFFDFIGGVLILVYFDVNLY